MTSKIWDRRSWPPELRQAHWRRTLGLSWRIKSQPTHIGPVMEEAYRQFQNIDWTNYDAKAANTNLYKTTVSPLVGTLLKLTHLAKTWRDRYEGKDKQATRFSQAAEEVAQATEAMTQLFRKQPGGPDARRPRDQSGSSSSHEAELVKKYKNCWKWPLQLTSRYYRLGVKYSDRDVARSLGEAEDLFQRIDWKTYEDDLGDRDRAALLEFHKDHIHPLNISLKDFIDLAKRDLAHRNGDEQPFKSGVGLLETILEKASFQSDLYDSCPGSLTNKTWDNGF